MVAEPAQRVVPGAPPSQAKTVAKKKKQQQQKSGQQSPATNGTRSHSQEAISKAAREASLMEKAPSHDKVNDSVKIQARDLAEEAERNGAIAAAQIMVEKENGTTEKESKSALQVILTKRIKVLTKKLQKAIAYEELSEDKINADMRKIIESKLGLEAGVAELTQASKALQVSSLPFAFLFFLDVHFAYFTRKTTLRLPSKRQTSTPKRRRSMPSNLHGGT